MKLNNIIEYIKRLSLAYPTVQEFAEGDIYEYLNSAEHKYPCVFLTIESITTDNDVQNINGTLFYVDRLLDDNSNKIDIQSVSITALKSIIEKAQETYNPITFTSINYTPFTEKFADLCAGSFAQFTMQVNDELECADDYELATLSITDDGLYNVLGYSQVLVDVTKVRSIDGHSGDITLGKGLTINQDNVLSGVNPTFEQGDNITITHTATEDGDNYKFDVPDMRYDDSEVKGMIEDVAEELESINEITIGTIVPSTTNFVEGTTYSIYNAVQRISNLFAGYWNYIKTNITDLIPSTASSTNQLADKSFVNETVAQNAANFRGNWAKWSDVPTDSGLYPTDYSGSKIPTNNDYMVVTEASGYDAEYTGSWRFLYTGDWATLGKSGWSPAYRIGSAFTDAQQAAIDSTITADKVSTYDSYEDRITAVETDKRDRIYIANKVYATDADGKDIALDLTTIQNYTSLSNKPTINGVEVSGDKTSADYNISASCAQVNKTAPNITLFANELAIVNSSVNVIVTIDNSRDLSGSVNEYRLQLTANAPIQISFTATDLKWSYDVPNYLVNGKTYEISIINKHATYLVF